MKRTILNLFIGVLLLSIQATATETGPNRCGEQIILTGNTTHYANGQGYTVTNATNNDFYKEEIYGSEFTASISNLPADEYTIKIYLAESYHDAAAQRTFNVSIEDELIVEKLDIFAEVGKDTEYLLSQTISYTPSGSNPELNILFETVEDMAKFNTIEILNSANELVACGMAHEFIAEIEPLGTGNPFIQHMYTADPSAHVFDNKVYVYPSHDQTNANGFNMRDYHVFSSSDLNHWEDHGVALDVDSVAWASEYMWAPDCAYKDSTYYFYFPAKDLEGEFRIGVATSASPIGPFVPEPEPIQGSFSVDPSVFIDDDGQAYMYFGGAGDGGQTKPWVAKMDESMKEFSEDPKALTGIDYWFEACWMNKVEDTYYLSYSTGTFHPDYPNSSALAYATSTNPMGPFTYQGIINGYVSGWTNHHSVLEYLGQSYLFYHNADLSGGNTVKRSICADYIHFTEGKLSKIEQTTQGVGSYNASKRIEAENYYEIFGAKKQESTDGGYQVSLSTDDSLTFNNVIIENNAINSIQLRLNTQSNEGYIHVISDSLGTIGTFPLSSLDGINKWQTASCPIQGISGKRKITLKYTNTESNTVAITWFHLVDSTTIGIKDYNTQSIRMHPNPTTGELYITSKANINTIEVINSVGATVYVNRNFNTQANLSSLDNGIYIVKMYSNNKLVGTEKLIIK